MRLFFMLLTLLLFGCKSIGRFEQQPLTLPESYPQVEVLGADSLFLIELSWTSFFKDPVLQQIIKEALLYNMEYQIAERQLHIAATLLKQQRQAIAPELSLSPSYSLNQNSANTQFGRIVGRQSLSQIDFGAIFSWEIDVWGRLRASSYQALLSYQQSQEALHYIHAQLISTIALTYFQLLVLDEQQQIMESTIDNREHNLQTMQALQQAGIVNQAAVHQVEAQLLLAKTLDVDLKRDIQLQEHILSMLQGKPMSTWKRGHIYQQEFPLFFTLGVPMDLLSQRPDLRAAELEIHRAFTEIKIAKRNFYPALRITAQAGLQTIDMQQLFNPSSLFTNLLFSLTQPIYNQRKLRSDYEIAIFQKQQAVFQFNHTLLTAFKEVLDALVSYTSSLEKQDLLNRQGHLYQQSEEFTADLLSQGMVNYLELIYARDRSLSAQIARLDNQYDMLSAIINLYRALGAGQSEVPDF